MAYLWYTARTWTELKYDFGWFHNVSGCGRWGVTSVNGIISGGDYPLPYRKKKFIEKGTFQKPIYPEKGERTTRKQKKFVNSLCCYNVPEHIRLVNYTKFTPRRGSVGLALIVTFPTTHLAADWKCFLMTALVWQQITGTRCSSTVSPPIPSPSVIRRRIVVGRRFLTGIPPLT